MICFTKPPEQQLALSLKWINNAEFKELQDTKLMFPVEITRIWKSTKLSLYCIFDKVTHVLKAKRRLQDLYLLPFYALS